MALKKKLSKETIRKMRAVVAAVKREPEFYNQSVFPQPGDCGTVCCAAGWVVWLDAPNRYINLVYQHANSCWWAFEADRILGLGYSGLFGSGDYWPYPFNKRMGRDTTPVQRAQAMADRWEHYIATDGAE